jgi:3-dehydroquinate synthase
MIEMTCQIASGTVEYAIEFGLLSRQATYLSGIASRFAIITDENVKELYGNALMDSFKASGLNVELFSFPGGELYKTRDTKENLEDQLFEQGFGRDCCVIALGGGIVIDLAGFIAATYCRGVPLVMMPTSLLAMVDACIGGKTGVNAPYGKNLIGAIYQPKKVVIDTSVLHTLPQKEFSNGIVEMIKHGLIADAVLFNYLEDHFTELLELNLPRLEKAIFESCRIKKQIIEQDEKEKGLRRLLNYGHTVGHALEKLTHYHLSHGEAVAIGLLVESYISYELGFLDHDGVARIKKILVHYLLPLEFSYRFSSEAILEAMRLDKKSLDGTPRFALIQAIGEPLSFEGCYCTPVDAPIIKKAIQWMNDDCCRD